MIRQRRFRADLFYRLNVFPITVPSLRERAGDIPILVQHFVRQFASRIKKQIIHISPATMEFLQQYDWPGNVRELQHFVERAVIRSSGPNLEIPFGELTRMVKGNMVQDGTLSPARTLAEAERDHILDVLRQVRGGVGGRNGAAARLGLPRTTLISRMRKLGIAQKRALRVGKPGACAGVENPDGVPGSTRREIIRATQTQGSSTTCRATTAED